MRTLWDPIDVYVIEDSNFLLMEHTVLVSIVVSNEKWFIMVISNGTDLYKILYATLKCWTLTEDQLKKYSFNLYFTNVNGIPYKKCALYRMHVKKKVENVISNFIVNFNAK